MKKEYDFSKAEQGKFYCKTENMKIPIYLDSALASFYAERARKRKVDMGTLINTVLRKEMDLALELGV
jgi:hypothetical protein